MAKAHVEIRSRWVRHAPFKRAGSDCWSFKVRDKRTGRMHFVSTRERDRRKAEQALLHWVEERETREALEVETKPRRFEPTFKEWLALKDIRPSTRADYDFTLSGVFKGLHDCYVDDFETKDIESFMKKLETEKLSGRTRQKHLFLLRGFFSWCRLRGYARRNPCDGVKVRRGSKRRGSALTPEEVRKLLEACREKTVHAIKDDRRSQGEQSWPRPPHLWLAVAIALLTGLRRGNVLRLRWGQVDLKKRTITLPAEEMKANADHQVPINQELLGILDAAVKAHKKPPKADDLVLGIELDSITTSYKAALKRAGLPEETRWHDLRHTFATWLSTRCSFAALRQLMGHSPGAVTLQYTHVPFDELLAAVDKLPAIIGPSGAAVPAVEAKA